MKKKLVALFVYRLANGDTRVGFERLTGDKSDNPFKATRTKVFFNPTKASLSRLHYYAYELSEHGHPFMSEGPDGQIVIGFEIYTGTWRP